MSDERGCITIETLDIEELLGDLWLLTGYDYVPERTCRNTYDGDGVGIFICSKCGHRHCYDYDTFDENNVSYCPNCGAKVVDEDE